MRDVYNDRDSALSLLQAAAHVAQQAEDVVGMVRALNEMCRCVKDAVTNPELFERTMQVAHTARQLDCDVYFESVFQLARLRREQAMSSAAAHLLDEVLPEIERRASEHKHYSRTLLRFLTARRDLALEQRDSAALTSCSMKSIHVAYTVSCMDSEEKVEAEKVCEIIIAAGIITRQKVVAKSKEIHECNGNLFQELVACNLISENILDAARELTAQLNQGRRSKAEAVTLLNYIDGTGCKLDQAMSALDLPPKTAKST